MTIEPQSQAQRIVAGLSLPERVAVGRGADFWLTHSVGQLPQVHMTDGPHGVRSPVSTDDHLAPSAPATCFPPSVGLAQTWDADLIARVAGALGRECQELGVDVLLGPGINIKRDPRCGRNFEYFSEDPFSTGVLATAYVAGVQAEGVGTSLKHFAANNQEFDRMRSSSDVDERTLREIYLRAFQRVVTRAQPWTVMAAYNKVNGTHACEHTWLLTQVLRDEWGFQGLVVSDWGAVADRPASVAAGLDLEMPGGGRSDDHAVLAAVAAGTLSEDAVDRAARKLAELAVKAVAGRKGSSGDAELHGRHHELAREVAARAIVLLKNDQDLLPLAPDVTLAVIGPFAQSPRIQGGGSSHVTPTRVDSPLDEIRARATGPVSYSAGFTFDGSGDAAALRAEAVAAAKAGERAVLFLGLSEAEESEGFDRAHIELPEGQLALLRDIVAVQPRTVVVLVHGGVVRLVDVVAHAPAILDTALLGQGGGAAVADVLFGIVNPSGKLAETVPARIEDVPSYLSFRGEAGHVRYGESLFVGYRWYDARRLDVTFPFGHGLSYTRFEYADLQVASDDAGLRVSVVLTNVGSRAGREVVQVYAGLPTSSLIRPVRELKAFAGVNLEPGESRTLELLVERDDLAIWHPGHGRWLVEDGDYSVAVGASSRDLRQTATVAVTGDPVLPRLSLDSTIGELMDDPRTGAAVLGMLKDRMSSNAAPADPDDNALGRSRLEMARAIPVNRLQQLSDSDGAHSLIELVSRLNDQS